LTDASGTGLNGVGTNGGGTNGAGNHGGDSRQLTRVAVSAVWVIGLSVVGKALGLFKDVAVASKFGTTSVMDAYLVAVTIPMIILHWYRSPIRSGFVPLFSEVIEKEGEEKAWREAGAFVGNFLVVSAAVAATVWIAAPALVRAIAPGFGDASTELAASLVRIMSVTIIFYAISGTLRNVHHVYGSFVLPGLAHPANNIIMMCVALFLTAPYGIRAMAYGTIATSIASILIQSPILWRHRKHVRVRIDFRSAMFWGVLKLGLPLFIGMAGAKLDEIIDRVFASGLAEGSISGLSYALRLIDLPREVLVAAFWTVLFPFYSRLAARGETELLADRLHTSMRIVFFSLFPISVAMAMLGEPFVRVVFQRGAFDETSVAYTVSALLLYSPTIWALGLTTTMISAYIAMKNTKTPVIVGFIRLGVKIGLIFLFLDRFQHAGIALSTSVSHVFKLVLFLILLPPVLMKGRFKALMRAFGGTAAATAVMAVALYFLGRWIVQLDVPSSLGPRIGVLLGASVFAAVVYLAAAWFTARGQIVETWSIVRSGVRDIFRKFRRGKGDAD